MENQLNQLKSQTHTAESDFQEAVMHYLLNPLEAPDEFDQALGALFESVTKYRIILDRLRSCLNSMHGAESLASRQETIKLAILNVNTRDAVLERLHKKVTRMAATGRLEV